MHADDLAGRTRGALDEAGTGTAEWTFERDDFGAVDPGLRRIYRQGRRRMRTAQARPSAEHLHDARNRAKDLWHAAQLLRQGIQSA